MSQDLINTESNSKLNEAFTAVILEIAKATNKNGPFTSAHHGYAILLEEVDELWDEVKKKRSKRDVDNMYKECVQIAACAIRFAADLCEKEADIASQ